MISKNIRNKLMASTACALGACAAMPVANAETPRHGAPSASKPNIIFILTDDLGYGDLGSFFQNARRDAGNRSSPWHLTPKLDRMADQGVRLTHHYCSAPVSAPSRASFLSGLSQGHANVRDNQFDKALANNHTVGTVLREAGYTTATIGKWGLPGPGEDATTRPAHPLKRGFDYYYGYLRHIDGHEHYPREPLYYKGNKAKNNGPIKVWENYKDVTDGLDKCYTADLFTARAKQWIIDQKNASPEKPFFLYLAYDTPHAVLELPTQAYPSGDGMKGGLQWLGEPGRMINTASGTPDSWIHPDYENATYIDKTTGGEMPWPNVQKRHATSVRRIDDAVGDLLQTIKDLGIDENTIVVFTSDNGPEMASYIPDQPYTPEFFASFGPFDGLKRDTLEGGLRVPAIVRWPGRIAAQGTFATPSAMWDWLPTFAELAGIPAPATADGISLVAQLTGKETRLARNALYFEYYVKGSTPKFDAFAPSRRGRPRQQMQAIRLGDLMALRYNIKSAQDDFEIYDVVRDPKQMHDLAQDSAYASIQAQFKALALQSRRPDPDAPRPYDDEFVPAMQPTPEKLEPGLAWQYGKGRFPWVPDIATIYTNRHGVIAKGLNDTPQSADKSSGVYIYEGYLQAPDDGTYIFELTADMGAVMRLHAATVIDADFGYTPGTRKNATINLKAGLHPITLTCRSPEGALPELTLKWSGPNIELQPVPASAFFFSKKQ